MTKSRTPFSVLALLGASALLLLVAVSAAAEPTVEVPQGSVARWAGTDCSRCLMNGRSWDAIEGTCYFPIDIDRRPDHYAIARMCGGTLESGWLIVTESPCQQEEIDFPDQRYVTPAGEDLARHYQEQTEVKPLFRRREGPAQFSLPLSSPADPLPASDNFGSCRTFNGEAKNRHTGADYAISGTAHAVAPGKVVLTGDHLFAGNSVFVDHGNGVGIDDLPPERDQRRHR